MHLGRTDIGQRRTGVPVEGGECDLIKIYETKISYSGTCEHVGSVGSDASEAYDEDGGGEDSLHSFFAKV